VSCRGHVTTTLAKNKDYLRDPNRQKVTQWN